MNKILVMTFFLCAIGYSQNYFPISNGNLWTYTGSFNTQYKRTISINDSVKFGDISYYLYGNVNSINDTIRKDISGNIWKLHFGVEQLWFDFSKDSGAVYTFPRQNNDYYNVKVRRNIVAKTYVDTFTNCVLFYFNDPGSIDDEVGYIFAPGIGMVVKYGAWSDDVLYSYNINGGSLSVSNQILSVPSNSILAQNYPNPFNPFTTINFQILTSNRVMLSVYNQLGQEVKVLINSYLGVGNYSVNFDAHNLPSGVYYYKLDSGSTYQVKYCMLIK